MQVGKLVDEASIIVAKPVDEASITVARPTAEAWMGAGKLADEEAPSTTAAAACEVSTTAAEPPAGVLPTNLRSASSQASITAATATEKEEQELEARCHGAGCRGTPPRSNSKPWWAMSRASRALLAASRTKWEC